MRYPAGCSRAEPPHHPRGGWPVNVTRADDALPPATVDGVSDSSESATAKFCSVSVLFAGLVSGIAGALTLVGDGPGAGRANREPELAAESDRVDGRHVADDRLRRRPGTRSPRSVVAPHRRLILGRAGQRRGDLHAVNSQRIRRRRDACRRSGWSCRLRRRAAGCCPPGCAALPATPTCPRAASGGIRGAAPSSVPTPTIWPPALMPVARCSTQPDPDGSTVLRSVIVPLR